MKCRVRVAVLAALCMACGPLGASVLYKSVDKNGVILFSDTPPEKSRDVTRLQITEGAGGQPRPLLAQAQAPAASDEARLRQVDVAVQKASAELDLAEHALALARRPVWTEPEVGKLTAARMTRSDIERIEFYKQGVKVARLALCELLQEKRRAAVHEEMTASAAGSPIYGPITLRQ